MLVKFLIFALVGYALYRMFMNDRGKKVEDSREYKEKLVSTGEMAKDPVCGAYVETAGGITVRSGDKVTHFCSYDCRDKYIKKLQEQERIDL